MGLQLQLATLSRERSHRGVVSELSAAARYTAAAVAKLPQYPQEHRLRRLVRAAAASDVAREYRQQEGGEAQDEERDGQDDDEWELVEVGKIGIPHGVRGEVKVQPLTDFPEQRLGMPGIRYIVDPKKGGLRQGRRADPRQVELAGGRPAVYKGHKVWLVKIKGVNSPEEAELLRNASLCIRDIDREPDEDLEDEDEFYVQELVGMEVVMQATGEEVGEVVAVYDGTGTHDVLRIKLAPTFAVQPMVGSSDDEGDPDSPGSSAKGSRKGKSKGKAQAASDDNDSSNSSGDEGGTTPGPSRDSDGAADGIRTALLPFVRDIVPVVDLENLRMEITPPAGLLEATISTPRRGAAPAKKRAANNQRRAREAARQRAAAGATTSSGDST